MQIPLCEYDLRPSLPPHPSAATPITDAQLRLRVETNAERSAERIRPELRIARVVLTIRPIWRHRHPLIEILLAMAEHCVESSPIWLPTILQNRSVSSPSPARFVTGLDPQYPFTEPLRVTNKYCRRCRRSAPLTTLCRTAACQDQGLPALSPIWASDNPLKKRSMPMSTAAGFVAGRAASTPCRESRAALPAGSGE